MLQTIFIAGFALVMLFLYFYHIFRFPLYKIFAAILMLLLWAGYSFSGISYKSGYIEEVSGNTTTVMYTWNKHSGMFFNWFGVVQLLFVFYLFLTGIWEESAERQRENEKRFTESEGNYPNNKYA